MEVSTFSEKELKSSLSKKSPLPKKSVRKVMQSPYETFWPLVTKPAEVEEVLRSLLPPVKRISLRIPWSECKGMTSEERLKVKKNRKSKDEGKSLRDQLVCGMNGLMHGIEDHSIASAIACEDFVPKFMTNAILDLAAIHRVPIIIYPNLRDLTKETLGFPCSCLGVKKEAAKDEDSHFSSLHKTIVEVAKEYELPENIAMYQCPRKEASDVEHKITHHLDLSWPCLQHRQKTDWKTCKKHLREKEEQPKTRKVGDEAKGNESSLSVGEESSRLKKGRGEACKALHGGASRSEGLEHHSHAKKNEAHPYLRTFANRHHKQFQWHKRRHSESVKQLKKTQEHENVKMARKQKGNDKTHKTKKKKSQVSNSLQPGENEGEHFTLHPYKSLKLVDI